MSFSFSNDWETRLDHYLTNPPEPECEESKFRCSRCGEPFEPEDAVYKLESGDLCYECANTWLSEQMVFATEEECYPDD